MARAEAGRFADNVAETLVPQDSELDTLRALQSGTDAAHGKQEGNE